MLGKAMRFVTVCTLAFAICGKANRDKSSSFSEGTTEDLEHRFGQETNSKDLLSTTMNVSSILMRKPTSETSKFSVVRKLAPILALLSSALTSADAFAVRPSQKGSNTAFAPIHTDHPLHGAPSGPLHASIPPFDGEAIKQMVHFVENANTLDGEAFKEMVRLVGTSFPYLVFPSLPTYPSVGHPLELELSSSGTAKELASAVQYVKANPESLDHALDVALAPFLFALGTVRAQPRLFSPPSYTQEIRALFSRIFLRKEAENIMDDVSEDTGPSLKNVLPRQ